MYPLVGFILIATAIASDNQSHAVSYSAGLLKCPLPCVDYANIHSWSTYPSLSQLRQCQEPLLVQLSITQPVDGPSLNTPIRACSIAPQSPVQSINEEVPENPKKADNLWHGSLETALACAGSGQERRDKLQLFTNNDNGSKTAEATDLIQAMQKFFSADDNCDENYIYAYQNGTAAGMYLGASLGKPTADTALKALTQHLHTEGVSGSRTVAQICGNGRNGGRVLGISMDATGDLAAVQKDTIAWKKGECIATKESQSASVQAEIGIMEITSGNATTVNSTLASRNLIRGRSLRASLPLEKREPCHFLEVGPGDECPVLVPKCGISASDFTKYNPKPNLCSTLQVGDFVCCSPGEPHTKPKPVQPVPSPDGTCAIHLIVQDDTCDKLSKMYGVSISDLDNWNKGKTWAFAGCEAGLSQGYNMCISQGRTPLPPPQAGTACGPIMPGTKQPTDNTKLADLNPCPLNACCSNWGFCGVFPAHCEVHAPPDAGPGVKLKEFPNTCVSNCGNDIKVNSNPPAKFSRVGYYESYNFKRDCLFMNASNANTDGSYTHMHWSFAEIDPKTWKPVIIDPGKQWDDFKKLSIKRIVSFGGWDYSTQAATYNIMRGAILDNRDLFASNLAQFVKDEGIDGIDIDWEYPGAPDIQVDGHNIAAPTDGAKYLSFLKSLKRRLASGKSVSIAAPASYWYLKAFPISDIAAVIDYIVYMTYDLHGQWDYGNPHSFDQCDSGTCLRSHVNLTETLTSLAMITKAGVPNNKVFVGEASYGRSFHMAKDGCSGPLCDFTGSRATSDAQPGRCTKTAGYLAYAEIVELISKGQVSNMYFDDSSGSSILTYNGDYVSYMQPEEKDNRRAKWSKLNFAGTIDWAVDLQNFGSEDIDAPFKPPESGVGCAWGEDFSGDSGDLCGFSCFFGFCPESLCSCLDRGDLNPLPAETRNADYRAVNSIDLDLNRLCSFACKHDYCPSTICELAPPVDDSGDNDGGCNDANPNSKRCFDEQNLADNKCYIYKDSSWAQDQASINQCKEACAPAVEEAKEDGRTTNYGCLGFWPGQKSIPWVKTPSAPTIAQGTCLCDNWLLNELADDILEALPKVFANICFALMSSLKLVLDIGIEAIPGAGKPLQMGMDMTITAAQMIAYTYSKSEDPAGAFEWWLSPCGDPSLVSDDLRKAFDIMSLVVDGVSSYKQPKNIKKESGKKGDNGNPKPADRGKPRAVPPNNRVQKNKNKKCNIKPVEAVDRRIGEYSNTIQRKVCKADVTHIIQQVITKGVYDKNAAALQIKAECPPSASLACYHYHSAIQISKQWETLTCVQEAAAGSYEAKRKAPDAWNRQHRGDGWKKNNPHIESLAKDPVSKGCQLDEYPPAYFLNTQHTAYINGGVNSADGGQLIRLLPGLHNGRGGRLWKGKCFEPILKGWGDAEFQRRFAMDKNQRINVSASKGRNGQMTTLTKTMAVVPFDQRPEWSFTKWPAIPAGDGLRDNACWDSTRAAQDPGFALLTGDPYYTSMSRLPQWKYREAYVKGSNGD